MKWNFPHLCTRLNNCCLTINTQKSLLLFLSTTIPQWIWMNKNVWGRGKNLQFSICRCAMHKKINSQSNSTTPTKKKVAITWIFEGREQIKLDSLIAEYVHELEMAASAVINSKSDDQQIFIPIEMTCSEDLVEFRRFCN